MALWFSSGAFNASNAADVLVQAHSLGIQGIELSSGLKCTDSDLQEIYAQHAAGAQRFLVHNYFPAPEKPFVLNVAALDADSLSQSMSMARNALQIARDLQASFYSIHAGFAARIKPELLGKPQEQAASLHSGDINRDQAYLAMLRNVRTLAGYAQQLGVDLLLENNVISPLYLQRMPINPLLLTEGKEICRFFEELACPNVGLLLDVAHAKVSATALNFDQDDFIDRVAPYVRCLHLSDNDGREDSNQPFDEKAWFIPHLQKFRHCEIVIEAYRLKPETMQAQQDLMHKVLS